MAGKPLTHEPVRDTVLRYYYGVASGATVACRKQVRLAEIVTDWMDHGAYGGRFEFSEREAYRHVGFMETFCRVPTGRMGAPLRLEDFQRALLGVALGFVSAEDERERMVREVFEIMARKNGKTTKCSALELDMLMNDREGAPQVYSVATKRDQADLGFQAALRMVRLSPDLSGHVRKRQGDLYCASNMGTMRPLASNTSTLDGLDVSCGVLDEVAAMRNRDLYDLVRQGTSARRSPLLWEISTNGFVRDGIFDAQYEYASRWLDGELPEGDENAMRFLPSVYELDDRDEWQDEAAWPKANPGLGTIKSWESLRQNVAKAREDPSFLPTLLVKDFNVPENGSSAWLTYEEAANPEPFPGWAELGIRYVVVGFDAADTNDLNAACALGMRDGDPHVYEQSMYWLPSEVLDEQTRDGNRRERDGVPYTAWRSRGLLRAWPGHKVDRSCLADWIRELRDQGVYVRAVAYDPWHMDDHTVTELRSLVGEQNTMQVRQGPRTMSQPLKDWRVALGAHEVVDGGNPVTQWCRLNASVRADVNGEIQLEKKGRDRRNRIDGVVAEACAWIALRDTWDEYAAFAGIRGGMPSGRG